MQNALLVGLSRQVALGRELDVVANNIANINTAGYKTDGALFEEFVGNTARAGNLSRNDSQVSFVRDRATWIDMSQGTIERTGNPLDLAIDGKGLLTVLTARGERYTRNGALQINPKGELVTSEGDQVLGEAGPIIFQPRDRDIKISADGTISARQGGGPSDTESLRGKLRVVSVENAAQLQKDGVGTFSLREGADLQADKQSRLIQGAVEKSNVRSVLEMTRMIEVTRSYTQVATLLSQQADLQRTAIDKLSEVPN